MAERRKTTSPENYEQSNFLIIKKANYLRNKYLGYVRYALNTQSQKLSCPTLYKQNQNGNATKRET